MKTVKLILVLIVLTLAGTGIARADRGHAHIGVVIGAPFIGGPYWGPGYYGPYPYYPPAYYPPVVVERQSPPVYIEQSQPAAAPAPAPENYWYYCAETKAYYPYVKDCPGPWQRVSPQPPSSR